jgi:hypothetical protein
MKLSDNKQLFDYLVSLSSKLASAGVGQLSEEVASAARTVAAIPATEFLGEARIVLRRVLKMDVGILDDGERADLLDVLTQLDMALPER